MTTIPDLVREAADRFDDAEAVVDGDERLSFAELAARIERVARAVAAAGIVGGDRVAIWAPNIHEWITAALGAVSAGAILVPVNTRFKGREAAYVLGKSRARLLFTVNGFLDTDYVAMLREGGAPDTLERIVLLRGTGAETFDEFLTEQADVAVRVVPDDVSDIIFTSGTTGHAKGVMTTHAQSVRVFDVWSREVGLREGDRYLIVNPFFHTFGYKAGILACLMRGATMVPQAVFDVPAVLAAIERERITALPGPPTLYQTILNHAERARRDLSSLRLAVTGAAVVPVALIKQMADELGFATVLTAYGLTEATGTVTMCRQGDDPETVANTCGRAIPDTEVRVVDDDDAPVATGQPGEVVVRGYNVMLGYFDDPEQTAATIVDGWLHTGDVGLMDARGYLKITDRKKDMFIVGGFNVYPAEVENELVLHPSIAQAAVVGAPDERMGEVGVAFVVPVSGARVDRDEVVEWARARMANYKVPRRVEIVDALPMNASGKVVKYDLRTRARALPRKR